MARPSLREKWLRDVLKDPKASRDEQFKAAVQLERLERTRKKIKKEAAEAVTAEEKANPADDPYSGGDWSFLDMTDPANTAPPHVPKLPVCDVCGGHGGFRRLNGTDACILHCGENRR
jgi:hypothetical protein